MKILCSVSFRIKGKITSFNRYSVVELLLLIIINKNTNFWNHQNVISCSLAHEQHFLKML